MVVAWLHHPFAQIHPFADGNGRVTRALVTWHLVQHDHLPIVVTRDDRGDYIDALETADDGNLNSSRGGICICGAMKIGSGATGEALPPVPSVLYSKFAGKSGRRWPGFGRRSWSRQKVWGLRW